MYNSLFRNIFIFISAYFSRYVYNFIFFYRWLRSVLVLLPLSYFSATTAPASSSFSHSITLHALLVLQFSPLFSHFHYFYQLYTSCVRAFSLSKLASWVNANCERICVNVCFLRSLENWTKKKSNEQLVVLPFFFAILTSKYIHAYI